MTRVVLLHTESQHTNNFVRVAAQMRNSQLGRVWLLTGLLAIAGLIACAPRPTHQDPEGASTARSPSASEPKGTVAPIQKEGPVPQVPVTQMLQDLHPDKIVLLAREDLAKRLGIVVDQIELMHVEHVTWPDASLGCPLPDMRYKQVPQDGLLIRLRSQGREYEYHSGGNRGPFLCEQMPKHLKRPPPASLNPPPGAANE